VAFGAGSLRSNRCPLVSLGNERLSLEFAVGADAVSLYLFVKTSLLSEPLMSCCPSQVDEKLFCYRYSKVIACILQGEEKNNPLGTFYLVKNDCRERKGLQTAMVHCSDRAPLVWEAWHILTLKALSSARMMSFF